MGYYPPYMPDSYLQVFRSIPSSHVSVKTVEAVQYKHIDQRTWEEKLKQPEEIKRLTGLGVYFDLYV